jgi:photosystem II stability/assembly factor-like uncharacterized protein
MYFATFVDGARSRIIKTKGVGFYEVYSTSVSENKITGLWIDSYDPSVIYAGTSKGLLLISRDFGESWKILREFTNAIKDLEMLSSDTRVIYIVTDGLIFKSPNQGNVFTQIWQTGSAATLITDLIIDPSNETVFYAATSRGLFRSLDSGGSFSEIKLPIGAETPNVSAISAPAVKKDLLLLGINSQIYKSEDAGAAWQIKQLDTSRKISVIAVKPDDPSIIFVGVAH